MLRKPFQVLRPLTIAMNRLYPRQISSRPTAVEGGHGPTKAECTLAQSAPKEPCATKNKQPHAAIIAYLAETRKAAVLTFRARMVVRSCHYRLSNLSDISDHPLEWCCTYRDAFPRFVSCAAVLRPIEGGVTVFVAVLSAVLIGYVAGLLSFKVKSRWCPRCGDTTVPNDRAAAFPAIASRAAGEQPDLTASPR